MLNKKSRNPPRVVPAGPRLVVLLPTWTKESTVTHLFATDIRSAPAWCPCLLSSAHGPRGMKPRCLVLVWNLNPSRALKLAKGLTMGGVRFPLGRLLSRRGLQLTRRASRRGHLR
jgi:hypothetical protein